MKTSRTPLLFICFETFLLCALSASAGAQQRSDQTSPQSLNPQVAPVTSVEQAVDRIIARERNEIATIRGYSPLIETYIQDMKPDPAMEAIPVHDRYLLGQANFATGIVDTSMLSENQITALFKTDFVPEGFLQMIYVDTNGFDRQHYRFEYIRNEFLGDVKCAVFDVTPLANSGRGRFEGRIWAETQDYTIVRFNGAFVPSGIINGYNMHFDSWRVNVKPHLWLPAYIFSHESDTKNLVSGRVHFLSQTRLWGYDMKNASRDAEFSSLTVESANVQDQPDAHQDRGPVEAKREWRRQAELNVLDRLQRSGLLAPPGEVDKVLETVENNLEATNNLNIQPEVHCRVLLTGTLESFSIGHTIVVSRGLLDVLPDEASLATMVAQELANILMDRPLNDLYGFNDTTNVPTLEVLKHFSFRNNRQETQQASEKAVELLKKSPYKDGLGTAGLFLKQLNAQSKSLSALINPHLGNGVYMAQQLMASSPALQPHNVDQIAALPIGARLQIDPWSDDVALLKTKPVPLYNAKEKMPFEITPFMPFLTARGREEKLGSQGTAMGVNALQRQSH